MSFNPSDKATKTFKDVFGNPVTVKGGTSNSGIHSHFTYVNPYNVNAKDSGWHVTTAIKGLGKVDQTKIK